MKNWRSITTQEDIAESLGVTQAAISKGLKAAGYIQKEGNWIPHGLKPRDVERRFCISEMPLERHGKKSFMHRIDFWLFFIKKSYVKPGQQAKSTAKRNALYLVGSEGCAVL